MGVSCFTVSPFICFVGDAVALKASVLLIHFKQVWSYQVKSTSSHWFSTSMFASCGPCTCILSVISWSCFYFYSVFVFFSYIMITLFWTTDYFHFCVITYYNSLSFLRVSWMSIFYLDFYAGMSADPENIAWILHFTNVLTNNNLDINFFKFVLAHLPLVFWFM